MAGEQSNPYQYVLQQLGLASTEQVKAHSGKLIKRYKDRRDVAIFHSSFEDGRPVTLFVKRTFTAMAKDSYRTLLRHGRVWSCSREEFENLRTLQRAGLQTCEPVAYGEECSAFRERFSYVIVAGVPAEHTLLDFLHLCQDPATRQRVLKDVARTLRRMHDAGLSWPDLYARHLFVTWDTEPVQVILIDVARLDHNWWTSPLRRARDLANLGISIPPALASEQERLQFLREYAGGPLPRLIALAVRLRLSRLSRSKKGRKLMASSPNMQPAHPKTP